MDDVVCDFNCGMSEYESQFQLYRNEVITCIDELLYTIDNKKKIQLHNIDYWHKCLHLLITFISI